jgi:hypothetical protein
VSTVAGLWNQFTDDEKTLLFKAAEHFLQERGAELIVAIAQHAATHTPAPCPDPAPVTGPLFCPDCGQVIDGEPEPLGIRVHGANRLLWLCYACRRARMLQPSTPED